MASLSSSFHTFSTSNTATSSSLLTKSHTAFAHSTTTTIQYPKTRHSFPHLISAVFTTGTPKTETRSGSSKLTLAPATDSHYEVLGVQSGATCQEIKKAYRRLARELHPDVTGVRNDSDFIRIHEAYNTLSDPDRRADYDRAMFIKQSLLNEWSTATRIRETASPQPTTAASGFPRRMSRTWETDQCW